jgi:hypothetical protein
MNVEEAAPFPRPSFSRKREPGDFALAALPALPESSPDSSSPRRRGSMDFGACAVTAPKQRPWIPAFAGMTPEGMPVSGDGGRGRAGAHA